MTVNGGRRLVVLVSALMLVLAACNGGAEPDQAATTDAPAPPATEPEEAGAPVDDASLVVGIPEEVVTLDPQLREAFYLRGILQFNLYEPLMGRNADAELVPLLAAAEPERVDDETWSFTLREGISFTNGEPFNAEAAAYSINRIIDEDYGSELLPRVSTITGAEAVNEYTVEVTTDGIDPILPARMEIIMMVPPEHAESDNFAEEPAGTGPYVWQSGFGDGPVILERNDDYWGDQESSIQQVEFRVIPDESTRISAVQAGEVDLILLLPPDAASAVPNAPSTPGIENPVVVFNSEAGITADPQVRQALNLALDTEAIAQDLWEGYADPMPCQAIAPAAFGFTESLDAIPYDPEQARQLLEDAGVAGETVDFVTAGDVFTLGREMGEVIASYWRDVGMEVNLDVREFDPYLEALYSTGEDRPPAIYLSTSTELLDADSSVTRLYVSEAELGGYANDQVDDLAQQARRTFDEAEREALYEELLTIACEDAAVGFLVHPQDIYGTSERLSFQPRLDGKLIFSEMSVTEEG